MLLGAVGMPGNMAVRKLLGNKEIFIGQVPLVSGELAEDFTCAMAVSEQTAALLAFLSWSILMSLWLSLGGFMIQAVLLTRLLTS